MILLNFSIHILAALLCIILQTKDTFPEYPDYAEVPADLCIICPAFAFLLKL